MQLSDAHIALLNSILTEWNRAEVDIKKAEQVCHNVVIPSIKELRYAGRRVVDVLTKMAANANPDDIDDLLADAKFDCHRARHDAIDAATSKIAIDLEIMVSKLGYEVILPVHAEFPQLVHELQAVRDKIAASRENRENREAIYSVIEATDFPELVRSYEKMMASEHIMISMAKRRRRSEAWGVVGTVLGAIGLGVGYIFWRFPIAP
jgi:hypothetical protein